MADPEWAPTRSLAPLAYGLLSLSQPSIRLFKLSKNSDDQIEGHMKAFRVDSAPAFEALSYMWGPEDSPTKLICVNKSLVNVRINLYMFLELFKVRSLDSWLWVDQVGNRHLALHPVADLKQICINQADLQERSSQVGLMPSIYGKAKQVVVCLQPINATQSPIIKGPGSGHTSVSDLGRDDLQLTNVFSHPYWSRLWISQEIILAQCLVLWYDTVIASWEDVKLAYEASDYHRSFVNGIGRSKAEHYGDIYKRHLLFNRPKEPLALHQVLDGCVSDLCKDRKDILYGIQSLVPDDQPIPVDYAKTATEVLIDGITVLLLTWSKYEKDKDTGTLQYFKIVLALATAMVNAPWTRSGKSASDERWKLLDSFVRNYGECLRSGSRKEMVERNLRKALGYMLEDDVHGLRQWCSSRSQHLAFTVEDEKEPTSNVDKVGAMRGLDDLKNLGYPSRDDFLLAVFEAHDFDLQTDDA